jgi:hypothetical protein
VRSARSTLRTAIEEKLMPMKPSHPGGVFYLSVLEPLGVSVSAAARLIAMRRVTLSAGVNGPHRFRLIGLSAATRLLGQRSISCASRPLYDAASFRKRETPTKVKRYVAKAAA